MDVNGLARVVQKYVSQNNRVYKQSLVSSPGLGPRVTLSHIIPPLHCRGLASSMHEHK